MKPLLVYLLIINALSFVFMLSDKYKAQNKLRRTSESALIWSAIIGGSLGCLLGMYLMRHKTKHPKFSLGIPLILVIHIIIATILFRYFPL